MTREASWWGASERLRTTLASGAGLVVLDDDGEHVPAEP